jgi:predicted nuclease of restriction endonuclease-like (RecB) superfamily
MEGEKEKKDSKELANVVHTIKEAILQSQQRALTVINQEQLALYYRIGQFVSLNTRNRNWGKGFIEAISEQLRKELPGLRGFSSASLRKMRTFYEEWQMLSDNSFVSTNEFNDEEHNLFVPTNELPAVKFKMDANFPIAAFMNIGFTHHYAIISKVKDVKQRIFYIQFAADSKAKVEDLERVINDDLYTHQGKLPNNFKKTIPDHLQAYRAITMFKDEYLLDFINTEELFVRDKDRDERVIEMSIVQNVKEFIMTFGKDFTFVGNQYHLDKFGVEEFPDLLFYNRELASLVCVELKDGPFKTSYLGQLAGYLRILDDEVRKPNENPSIGLILCRSANKKFVEYVIQDYDKPMGVATYETTANMEERLKCQLPPVEELQKLL